MLKNSKPAAESINISATGMTYSSLGVALFKSLKSMHTLSVPFFLITGTIFANHSTYLAVLINLLLSSLSISSLILDIISGANLLGNCFTGFFPALIGSLNSTISLFSPGISL
ncbi:hypothetical protein QL285_057598 [Trifolium repens]|nr:hypothetical protein QL285_057598 [Trifolium repens]